MPGPGQRARHARRALARRLMVSAAERVFAEQGYADARMQDVAAEAGVSLKTLYAAFESKADLFETIQAERRTALWQRLRSDAGGEGSALDGLLRGVRVAVEFLLAHPDFLRIHLREGNAWALRTSAPRGDRWRRVIAMQADVFRRGIAEGIFVDEDPELLAKMMIALYQVQLADWLDRRGARDPGPLIERIEAHVRRTFCHPDVA